MKRCLFLLWLTLPLCIGVVSCHNSTKNDDEYVSKEEDGDSKKAAQSKRYAMPTPGMPDYGEANPGMKDYDARKPTETEAKTQERIVSPRRGVHDPDSINILGTTYRAFYDVDDIFKVERSTGEIILEVAELSPLFDFDDFNGDGFEDIRIHYNSNVPSVQDLLLFDKGKRNFVLVENFQDVPAPKAIGKTGYYYSYHRSGCADMSWDSDLFSLDNNKLLVLGNISVDCDIDTVFINKVRAGKRIAFRSKPLDVLKDFEEYKWGFIEDYWTKNYKAFK